MEVIRNILVSYVNLALVPAPNFYLIENSAIDDSYLFK